MKMMEILIDSYKPENFEFDYLLNNDSLSNIEIKEIIDKNIIHYIYYYGCNNINLYKNFNDEYNNEIKYIIRQYFYHLESYNPFYYIKLLNINVDYIVNNFKELEFFINLNYSVKYQNYELIYPRKLNYGDYLSQLEPRINRVVNNVLLKYKL